MKYSNDKKCDLSVIIPAYQAENTIARAISSVLSMPFDNFEIIVVDDGSDDATSQIVGSMKANNPRIKLIQQNNRGRSCARNAGFSASRGKWIMFLDADDYLLADGVGSIYSYIDNSSNMIMFPMVISSSPNCVHGTNTHIDEMKTFMDYEASSVDVLNILYGESPASNKDELFSIKSLYAFNSPCSKLIKKDALMRAFNEQDKYGNPLLFKEDLMVSEDRIFNFVLLHSISDTTIVFSNKALYYYDVGIGESSGHIYPEVIENLVKYKEAVLDLASKGIISDDDAVCLLRKEVWERFFLISSFAGDDLEKVRKIWINLINEKEIGSFFLSDHKGTLLEKMHKEFIRLLIRIKKVNLAIDFELFLTKARGL